MNSLSAKYIKMVASVVVAVTVQGARRVPVSQPQKSDPPAQAIVLQSGSSALIEREGWTEFSHLSIGTTFEKGDLIDPQGTPVRILCANLIQHDITQLGPYPCPSDREILHQNDLALAGWQRGSTPDILIPYLITPRASAILTAQPYIWWNAVTTADSYQVTLHGADLPWSTLVIAPKHFLVYPAKAPPLVGGNSYSFEITALNQGAVIGSSSDVDLADLSFSVLAPDKARSIYTVANQIQGNVKETDAGLILAYYDIQNGLNADAIAQLTSLTGDLLDNQLPTPKAAAALLKSPVPYLLLGDLFLENQTTLYASAAYQTAADRAATNQDIEAQAKAAVGLARLATDNEKQATFARAARDFWLQLGAQTQADAVITEFHLSP